MSLTIPLDLLGRFQLRLRQTQHDNGLGLDMEPASQCSLHAALSDLALSFESVTDSAGLSLRISLTPAKRSTDAPSRPDAVSGVSSSSPATSTSSSSLDSALDFAMPHNAQHAATSWSDAPSESFSDHIPSNSYIATAPDHVQQSMSTYNGSQMGTMHSGPSSMEMQEMPMHPPYSHAADMAMVNLFALNHAPIGGQPMVPSQIPMGSSHPGYTSTSDASAIPSQRARFSLPSPALSASYIDSSHGKSTWGLATPISSPSMASTPPTNGVHGQHSHTGQPEPAKLERRQRRYRCLEAGCERRFTSEYTRAVHMNGVHTAKPRKMLACSMGCGELFGRSHDRLRHEVTQHGKVCEFLCRRCEHFFCSERMLVIHKCRGPQQGRTRWPVRVSEADV